MELKDNKELVKQNSSLWDISQRTLEIEKMIEDSIDWETGEFTEDYEKCVALQTEVQKELLEKSKGLIWFIRKNESYEKDIEEEIKRLRILKDRQKKKNENLKTYIKQCMEVLKIDKIETPTGILSIRKSPASVEVYDESLLSEEYQRVKTIIEPDKNKLKEDLKAGKEIQGARLVTDKTSLNIK